MKTKVIKDDDYSYAVEVLRSGGIVSIPNETVYALACNGLDAAAVASIYEVKGRPAIEPLSLLVADIKVAETACAGIPKPARLLAEAFWPGKLTLVLPRRDTVPHIVTAGGNTVAIRCPEHPRAVQFLRLAGIPLAAAPAYLSDAHIPKSADEVLVYFNGKINCIIDCERCKPGSESTIVSLSSHPYKILRQGVLPEEKIRHVLSLIGESLE